MNPKFKSFCPRYELINGHKIERFFFIESTVIKDNMNQNKCNKCTYCRLSESDKQKYKHHPLSLFPDLMKEKVKIEHFDEHEYQPTNPPERDYHRPNFIHTVSYNIGVFRWNSVEPFRKWVSALTACRTPSTEYGPEHPVLLDEHYPISYWICLQQETETALEKVGVLMEIARSYEVVSKRFMRSRLGDQFVEHASKICNSPSADTIRTLLEMTHSLETQIKKIPNIIQHQITMTKLVTKINPDVLPLILSYL